MSIIEFKSPDEWSSAKKIIEGYFLKQKKKESLSDLLSESSIYISNKKLRGLNFNVKPRSPIVIVDKRKAKDLSSLIVYEDKKWLVLDKPHGLSTQKTLKRHEDNLYDQVRLHYLLKENFPSGLPYVGLHHRLDRDTSGLVLMTKQRGINKEVSDLFKNRKIKKTYLAFVEWGEEPLPEKWKMDCGIRRSFSKRHPFKFEVHKEGDKAITNFEKRASEEGKFHEVQCFPKTGRTHQLRVHLSHYGYPILGDPVYGRKKSAHRMMLHASSLEFNLEGKSYSLKSNLDFKWQAFKEPSS